MAKLTYEYVYEDSQFSEDELFGHDEEMRPRCEACGKTFKKRNQLRQHLIIHKPAEEKPYRCSVCDDTFSRRHHLTVHEVTHTRNSAYTCRQCYKVCTQMSDLRRHQLTHRLRVHSCQHCGKAYADEDSLQTHMVKHTNKKVYPCKFCERTFSRPKNLQKHILVHTSAEKYTCKYCEKGFVRESSLQQHELAHTRDQRHTCASCGKSFVHRGNYLKHLLTHKDGALEECEVCGKKFLQSASYKRHMRTHSEGNAAPEEEVSNPQSGSSEEIPIPEAAETQSALGEQATDNTIHPDLPPSTLEPQFLSTENEVVTSIAAYEEEYDEARVADIPDTVEGLKRWLMMP